MIKGLMTIILEFFPAYAMAVIQPVDQGITATSCSTECYSAQTTGPTAAWTCFQHEKCTDFLSSLSGVYAYFVKRHLQNSKQQCH